MRAADGDHSHFGSSPLVRGSIATFTFGAPALKRRGVLRCPQPLALRCSCVWAAARPRRDVSRAWAAWPRGDGRQDVSAGARARRHQGGWLRACCPAARCGSGGAVAPPQPAALRSGGGADAPYQPPGASSDRLPMRLRRQLQQPGFLLGVSLCQGCYWRRGGCCPPPPPLPGTGSCPAVARACCPAGDLGACTSSMPPAGRPGTGGGAR